MGPLPLMRSARRKINLRFLDQLPGGASFARASQGHCFGSDGALKTVAADTARFDCTMTTKAFLGLLVEAARTNVIANSDFIGASASPSTMPTNWAVETAGGLTTTVAGVGTENGMPTVDLHISGTATGTNYQLRYAYGTSASSGQTWCASVFARKTAGSSANVSSAGIAVKEMGGGYLYTFAEFDLSSALLKRSAAVRTLSASYNAQFIIRLNITNGAAVDITLRLACPQFELGAGASSPIRTSGSAVTRAADALSFVIPAGVSTLRFVFDDNSSQDVSVSPGAYTVPVTLNRARVMRIRG